MIQTNLRSVSFSVTQSKVMVKLIIKLVGMTKYGHEMPFKNRSSMSHFHYHHCLRRVLG